MLNDLKKDLPILVMEIGINANGSVELAKKTMDTFFNIVHPYPLDKIFFKFQKRIPKEDIPKSQWDIPRTHPVSGKLVSYLAYKLDMEFSRHDYYEINHHISERYPANFGGWYTSVWGIGSLNFMLDNFKEVPFIKIPSALIGNKDLIREAAKSGKSIILSTGGATEDEVLMAYSVYQDHRPAASILGAGNQELYVLACTSTYPTPPNEVNLNKILTLDNLLPKEKIGFSSHSVSPLACKLAAVMGATMVEFHITMDRAMSGSDHAASMEPNGARLIARDIMQAQRFLGDGKLKPTASELAKLKTLGK